METQRYSANEFTFKVTQIRKAILQQGFFEMHLIHVEVLEKDGVMAINLEMEAKYGPGIASPPLDSDYKDMKSNANFSIELEQYKRTLFWAIERMFQP